MIPVNNDFQASESGVEIFVFSGEFHSDIILPIQSSVVDWRIHFADGDFRSNISEATHVAIGWGEKNFYLHTPTWSDLKLSTAANALLVPSDTVMHVEMTVRPEYGKRIRSVRISNEQYAELFVFVKESFARDAQDAVKRIEGQSYGNFDAFYEANGSYHAFRTCNCWVGEALQEAGVRVGWFTPLPKSVFVYLPDTESKE